MSEIFITSDLHFGHDKDFIWGARGFSNVEEMNEAIVANWNSCVKPEDEVYILGDVMLGDHNNIKYLDQLNGRIHIVFGNHDSSARQKLYANHPKVVEVAWAIMLKYKKHHFFMTHFPTLTKNGEVQGLGQCTINLFGHTHQTENFHENLPWMYHVGVDSHNCFPVKLDDALNEMKMKMIEYKNMNLEN